MSSVLEEVPVSILEGKNASYPTKPYDGLDGVVSSSSRTFAAYRAIETENGNALFRDPLAADLAGPEALGIVRARIAESSLRGQPFAVRTRWFDDAICHALGVELPAVGSGGADVAGQVVDLPGQQQELAFPSFQVVMFGCGMDARAWRLPAPVPPDGTPISWPARAVYEIDFADVMGVKEAVLEELRETGRLPALALAPNRYALKVDLLIDDWRASLEAHGFSALLPTVWVMEGLLMYLTPEVVTLLLTAVTEMSSPGSSIVASGVSVAAVEKYGGKDNGHSLMAAWKMGSDDPQGLFASFGWKTVSAEHGRDAALRFGRPLSAPRTQGSDGSGGGQSRGPWYIHVRNSEGELVERKEF